MVWQTRRTLYRGRQVFTKHVHRNGPAGLPPFSSLRQADTERFLRDACVDAGVRFHWEAEVIAVETSATGVSVRVNDGRSFHGQSSGGRRRRPLRGARRRWASP